MNDGPYTYGVCPSYKDVSGRPCPAVLYDGDSVFCLFPSSSGETQARAMVVMLNGILVII